MSQLSGSIFPICVKNCKPSRLILAFLVRRVATFASVPIREEQPMFRRLRLQFITIASLGYPLYLGLYGGNHQYGEVLSDRAGN